eukprot:GHVS01063485.1.p2 GENE.GHVS01063485.1~~GHVS01063485.1.p2  ORF type:complete len:107 (-),score=10.80 GHVS01063485.1:73-393(-)
MQNRSTKHIDTRWHFIRGDLVVDGTVGLEYVCTSEMIADMMTNSGSFSITSIPSVLTIVTYKTRIAATVKIAAGGSGGEMMKFRWSTYMAGTTGATDNPLLNQRAT